jgi:hypothetical protein
MNWASADRAKFKIHFLSFSLSLVAKNFTFVIRMKRVKIIKEEFIMGVCDKLCIARRNPLSPSSHSHFLVI